MCVFDCGSLNELSSLCVFDCVSLNELSSLCVFDCVSLNELSSLCVSDCVSLNELSSLCVLDCVSLNELSSLCHPSASGCLAMAELGRRGLLLPARLGDGTHFAQTFIINSSTVFVYKDIAIICVAVS